MTSQPHRSLFAWAAPIVALAAIACPGCGGELRREAGQGTTGASMVDGDDGSVGGVGGGVDADSSWDAALSNCRPQSLPKKTYSSEGELGRLLVGRWLSCQPPTTPGYGFPGEKVGVEFVAGGTWFALSESQGQLVRNGSSGTWSFSPPDDLVLDAIGTNAPWITSDPKTMKIGIDPTFPMYVAAD